MKASSKIMCTIFALAFSLNAVNVCAKDKITIAVHDYLPYYNQEGKGLMVDIYKAAYDRFGVDVGIKVFPIKRALSYLFDNKVDAFSPGHIFMSSEMKEKAEWEDAFIVALVMFYYKPHLKKPVVFNSLDDLKDYKLAVLVNTSFIPLYKKHHLEYYESQSPQRMIKMARAGHVDFVVITLLTGMILINQDFPEEYENFDYFVFKRLPCSLAVSTGNPSHKTTLSQFQTSLKDMKSDGTYIHYLEKYWGKGNIPKVVLFSDLESSGVDHIDPVIFNKYPRNSWGEIITGKE